MRRGKNSSEAAGGESMQYGYPREGLRLSNPVVRTIRQKTLYFWRYRKKLKIQKILMQACGVALQRSWAPSAKGS